MNKKVLYVLGFLFLSFSAQADGGDKASLNPYSAEANFPLSKYVSSEQIRQIDQDLQAKKQGEKIVMVDTRNIRECTGAMAALKKMGAEVDDSLCTLDAQNPIFAVRVAAFTFKTSVSLVRCKGNLDYDTQMSLTELVQSYCPYVLFTATYANQ